MTFKKALEKYRAQLKPWEPVQLSEFNGNMARLVYFKGQFDAHFHDYDELFIVLEGSIELNIPGQNIVLHAGDAYIAAAGTVHSPMSSGAYAVCVERLDGVAHFTPSPTAQ